MMCGLRGRLRADLVQFSQSELNDILLEMQALGPAHDDDGDDSGDQELTIEEPAAKEPTTEEP